MTDKTTKVEKTEKDWENEIAKEKKVTSTPPKVTPKGDTKVSMKDINISQQPTKTKTNNNISKFCNVYLGTNKDVDKNIENEYNNNSNYTEDARDETTHINRLLVAKYGGLQNFQFEFLLDSMKQVLDANTKLTNSVEGLASALSKGATYDNAPVLTGAEAKQTLIARMGGLLKVYLYNSGFWVSVKSLNISELNDFYSSVDINENEYGRILGGYSYLTTDIYIKEKFAELVPTMVVDSNLKDWSVSDTLINNISIHDYDTLLWAACSMQFKEGVDIGVVCANCDYVETNTKFDLKKLKLTNFDKIPDNAIKFLRSPDVKTSKMLKQYREEYLGFKEDVIKGKYLLRTAVPTLGEYLKRGVELVSELISTIRGEATMKNDDILRTISIFFYPMLSPWISSLTLLKDDNTVDFTTMDTETILLFLSEYKRTESRKEEDVFVEKIINFIKISQVTFICASALECPKCKTKITNESDLFPIDVQELFFMITCQQIELVGTV